MPSTKTLISTLALLVLLTAPQARAATAAACQDATKASVNGTIHRVVRDNVGTWFGIEETAGLDCGTIFVVAKNAGNAGGCHIGNTIHAEGTLSKPDHTSLNHGWILSDTTDAATGKKYSTSFSCQ